MFGTKQLILLFRIKYLLLNRCLFLIHSNLDETYSKEMLYGTDPLREYIKLGPGREAASVNRRLKQNLPKLCDFQLIGKLGIFI